MLKISEIFYSLQGEGKFIGSPSVFVRVGLCNLQCMGFGEKLQYKGKEISGCDSIYAANPLFKDDWQEFTTSKDLIEAISMTNKTNQNYDIVLTGGEPSLYFNESVLLEAMEYFLKRYHKISVESNGSIFFKFNSILENFYFNLSIKLSNSLEQRNKRINIAAIQNILDHARGVAFKFVLDENFCEDGIKEIKEILSLISGSYEVFIMPMGSDVKTLDRNIKSLIPLCLQYGYKLTDRMHIRIWGNQRGF